MNYLSGIYIIKTRGSFGKTYVGQSQHIYKRWASHKRSLRNNSHKNQLLQNYYNKYGANSLEFKVIEECPLDQLTEREKYWLDFYRKNGGVFNIVEPGEPPMRGRTHSEELKQRLREERKGKSMRKSPLRQEEIDAFIKRTTGNKVWLGRKHSEETKRKISEGNRGKTLSEETKEKLRQIGKERRERGLYDSQKKSYKFINPEGELIEVNGLAEFCRKNNLSAGAMCQVASGKKIQHKGWKSSSI